ncbi:uncharacterized protein LOC143212639 isoform X2 [Lasioglossum baleicum]|uniref:uncharacterized protein LOC143212639 isoform X2 n=1 Tax=Lasioglossum baleicum TaxID=434251 RepID=UPI003FCECDF8
MLTVYDLESTVFQLILLNIHGITFIRLVYFVSFSCTVTILLIKYIIVMFLQDLLKKSLENLARWHSSIDQTELRIFEKFANEQRRTAIIFLSAGTASLVICQLTLLSPILLNIVAPLNDSRPVRFILVIQFEQGDDYFVAIYVYFLIACVILISFVATTDCIMSIMMHYHSAVFKTISYRTNVAINEWLNPKNITFEKDHRLYQRICEVIDLYQDIQRYCDC